LVMILISAGMSLPVMSHDLSAASENSYDAREEARKPAQPPAPLVEQHLRALTTDFYAGRITLEEYRAQKRALLDQPEPRGTEERLKALQGLWERGILSPEEYQQKRAEILKGL